MPRSTLPRLHPLTGAPLRPVGHRKDGRAIWPVLGGSETGGDGGQHQGGTDGGHGAQRDGGPVGDHGSQRDGQQQGQRTDQQQASRQAGDWDGKVESLPEPVQKMIRDLRKENGDRRTALTAAEQRQQDVVKAFARAAGIQLPDDDKGPDPAQLTQQLTATQQQARQAAVELAVYRTAGKHSGDPDALLDSRSFLNAVTNLDPAAEDFATQVDAAIKAAVDNNPKLKVGRAPGASGADHTGGSGEHGATFRKPTSMHDAAALAYGTT